MSLGPGISGPVHFCRRLFCEPAPLSIVQQTLESVLRKDQERFSSKWNFPLVTGTNVHDKLSSRQPLADQTSNAIPDNATTHPEESVKGHWQMLTSSASFYTSPPRRLKAFRRLNQTVAQKTHTELMKKVQEENPKKIIFETTNPVSESITPTECSSSVPSTPVKNKRSITQESHAFASPFKFSTSIRPPLIIKPVENSNVSSFLPPFIRETIASSQSRVEKPLLNVIKPRYSEQLAKRKSGAKVTDYFTVSKRPRQSLK